ncbi:MAG: glutamine--fructose-6-phosphate transaminase (isomerizing) [Lachnospiraceae bacterium]|nr:glutamine--fructose-6-phosphate transaminase (isomerizing) [Lachnospiraceae bacterium]
MCGIVGYTGTEKAEGVIADSLTLLEYRGYDSAGLALAGSKSRSIDIYKCAGRVSDLRSLLDRNMKLEDREATCGVGHTRWATHGGVTDTNAHPHRVGTVTLVHNGIIENFRELTEEFRLKGKLKSETDTEVVAGVLDSFYAESEDPKKAIVQTLKVIKGTFALVIMFANYPDVIFAVRNVSPIVATQSEQGSMLASDLTALTRFTDRYFVIPEYTIAELHRSALYLWTMDGKPVDPEWCTMDWEKNSSDKGGYPFYMEKEINEQPDSIRKTIESRLKNGLPDFSVDEIDDSIFEDTDNITVAACGTAMHTGLVFQNLARKMLKTEVKVCLASEYMYESPVVGDKTLLIAVSQSGETIDTLQAVKYAKERGARTLGIINVRGSSIARECEGVLFTNAGPEIAVASTKAYTTQLSLLYLVIAKIAMVKGLWDDKKVREFTESLVKTPESVSNVLEEKNDIHIIARNILEARDLFMIGRGLDYAALQEGSLKLKEVSYIHSEAYASGELKHGPIALITQETPVVALATQESLLKKELSNVREVRSRGASVVLFVKEAMSEGLEQEFNIVRLPDLPDEFMVFPAACALQLLAYYVSSDKGFDVDKPRNLAKVVTVE